MGVVYLAKDPLIGRLVALKTLRAGTTDPEEMAQFRRRFMREAQSAGILSHPHIVTVHDVVDDSEEGMSFIAMEYVRGTTLKELLRAGRPLDLPFVVDVVRQIAEALDYAHSQGVVHRDVKPANVLINGDGEVKITDFGIARLASSDLTMDTELLGTPNYMAPEQIRGDEVDSRADIFSLGVLVYEMLTGTKPFRGDSLTAVTHNILHEDFVPLEEQDQGLPDDLEGVLRRCLAKQREDRYGSAGELAEALAACAADRTGALPERKGSGPRAASDAAADGQTRMIAPRPVSRRPASGDETQAVRPLGRGLGERPPWWRAALLAVVTLLLALTAGSLLTSWALPDAELPPTDPEHELRLQYLPWVRQGRQLLAEGDPMGAAAAFRKAERLAPGRPEIRGLRQDAEERAEGLSERQRRISQGLAEAQDALAQRRYRDAITASDRVLTLASDNGEAREIRALARRRLQEQLVREPSSEPEPAAEVAAAEEPSLPPESREPAASGPARLETSFTSRYQEEPVGTLAIFLDDELLFRHPFRFVEKKGFLGLRREAYDGNLRVEPVRVAPSSGTLRIYVTPKGKAAEVKTLEADFSGGGKRRLLVQWSADGELTARLE